MSIVSRCAPDIHIDIVMQVDMANHQPVADELDILVDDHKYC
jgi:hypothetical protein